MLDRARFPRLAQYLDTLPQGLASFAECKAKGDILRHLVEKHPIADTTGLPDDLATTIKRPIASTSWLHECLCMGLHLAIGDAYKMDDAAYDRWLYEHNAGLLDGRFMFRAIMSLATPGVLMHGAAIRFNAFHLGTRLDITSRTSGVIDFQIAYPKGIYTELCVAAFRAAFQAALDMTQAKDVRCKLTSFDTALSRFQVTWSKWD